MIHLDSLYFVDSETVGGLFTSAMFLPGIGWESNNARFWRREISKWDVIQVGVIIEFFVSELLGSVIFELCAREILGDVKYEMCDMCKRDLWTVFQWVTWRRELLVVCQWVTWRRILVLRRPPEKKNSWLLGGQWRRGNQPTTSVHDRMIPPIPPTL